jgi:hypothetical protein
VISDGDGRWHIQWDFVDCGEAKAAGSNIPGPSNDAHWGYTGSDGKKDVNLRGSSSTLVRLPHPSYIVDARPHADLCSSRSCSLLGLPGL